MGSFLGIKSITRTKSDKFYARQIQGLSRKHTYVLAKTTEEYIKEKISELIKRPGSTGTMAEGFKTYTTLMGHGVGKISYLNTNVPWWRHQNYGSEAIGANWRHFVPNGLFSPGNPSPEAGSFRNGRWDTSSGAYGFMPNKPIPAMNYIEKTLSYILPNVHNIIKDIK